MTQAILSLVLWLLVFPFFTGVLPTFALKKSSLRLGSIYLYGFLFVLALFQIMAVPFVLARLTLTKLIMVFKPVVASLSVVGFVILVVQMIRTGVSEFICLPSPKKFAKSNILTFILFMALILFQVIMSVIYMTPNGDDSYYIGEALIANARDLLYTIDPYTGHSVYYLQPRHVLAPFPLYYAMLARESGIHVTIIAHTILPPVLILVTYMMFYKIAHALFDGEFGKVSIFMVLIAGIQMFGGNSIYTNEVFFLTRTWQGKSVLANIALPGAFMVMLYLSKRTEKKKKWEDEENRGNTFGIYLLMVLVNLTGALASSMGLLLLLFFERLMALIIAIRNKRFTVLLWSLLCQAPTAVYLLLYIRRLQL